MNDFQKYIYISKYSKWIDKEKRRETWEETNNREMNFWIKKFPFLENEIDFKNAFDETIKLNVFGSMRCKMSSGIALERDNIAGYNCSGIAVDNPRVFDEIFYILMNGTGVGFSVERQFVTGSSKMPEISEEFYDTDTTIVVADSKIGWASSLRELISLLYVGKVPKWDLSKVRPAGSRLKVFGGRSSGPEPLNRLFKYTVRLFKSAKGRKLNSIECHDLICKIAETVIVGSVRRSACISFSNLTDTRLGRAKDGSWWLDFPERALSNNSVMYTEKPDLDSFTNEMRNLYKSKSGERGIVNQTMLKKKAISCDRNPEEHYLLNPCLTYNTKLLTDNGYFSIGELVGEKVNAWNGKEFSEVVPFSTGENPILKVVLSNGVELECTPYHKFILDGEIRKEAKDLIIGDKLQKFDMPIINKVKNNYIPPIDPYSQGFYAGDGETNAKASKLYFTKYCCENRLSGTFGTQFNTYKMWKHGKMLPKNWVPMNELKQIKINWLAGLFDSDGTVLYNPNSCCVHVSSIDLQFLKDVRLLLTTLGVQATIGKMKPEQYINMPDGIGGHKKYLSQNSYRLQITPTDLQLLIDNGLKCNRLTIENNFPQRDARRFITVVDIIDTERTEETFCATENKNHSLCFDGIITGQCGEAILPSSGGVCNLSEVVVRPNDTLEDLKTKVKYATIFGTLQSTLTNFRYLRNIWKQNAEEERLLGVSLTGIMDHPVMTMELNDEPGLYDWFGNTLSLPDILSQLKEVAVETNKKWSKKLGISQSKQLTLIKPSGTVSLLANCSSGIHPRYSEYYIRRVTQDNKDPLTELMKSEGIPFVISGDKTIFSFFIEAPNCSKFQKDFDAIKQLKLWSIYQQYWCDGNPSQTIYYSDNDFLDVCSWVWKNWDKVGGLSFFPINDNCYENAPYEEITKEEYLKFSSTFPTKINWERIKDFEKEDSTSSSQEIACSGGKCEL